MNETATEAPQRSNATLWLLIAISVLPFIAAYAYYYMGDFKKFGNNGDLINPVIDIQTLKLSDESGQAIERASLTKKWRMMLVVGADCTRFFNLSLIGQQH